MEEGDIGHHRLLIWLCDTYVCEVGRRGDIRAEVKNSGIGIGREREVEQREVWKGWWGGGVVVGGEEEGGERGKGEEGKRNVEEERGKERDIGRGVEAGRKDGGIRVGEGGTEGGRRGVRREEEGCKERRKPSPNFTDPITLVAILITPLALQEENGRTRREDADTQTHTPQVPSGSTILMIPSSSSATLKALSKFSMGWFGSQSS